MFINKFKLIKKRKKYTTKKENNQFKRILKKNVDTIKLFCITALYISIINETIGFNLSFLPPIFIIFSMLLLIFLDIENKKIFFISILMLFLSVATAFLGLMLNLNLI